MDISQKLKEFLSLIPQYKAITYIPNFKNFWKPLLFAETSFLPEMASAPQRIWHLQNNTTIIPVCPQCQKTLTFRVSARNYPLFCSPKCSSSSDYVQQKIITTNLEKYGVIHNAAAESCKEKRNQTMLKKYGVKYTYERTDLRRKKYDETFENRIKNFDKVKPLFSKDQFIGVKHRYDWECLSCKTKFNTHLINGINPRCPNCFPVETGYSGAEKELVSFLQSMYSGIIIENDRTLITPFELDIVIPELKIAIEYCGLYWHSELMGKNATYHLEKLNSCKSKGYRLITIFEDEWIIKQEIVKSRLSTIFGKNKRVFARKTKIKEIDAKITSSFLEENHIQGSVKSSINLGLMDGSELIAIMTFGKSRFNKNAEWELIRFANKLNYSTVGGASKLLNHFIKEYSPNSIISYSDKRWNTGNLYAQLGFEYNNDSPPNYFYFNNNLERKSRIQFQKHKLSTILENFDSSLTEVENMYNNKWNRIFDCGNSSYILQLSKLF